MPGLGLALSGDRRWRVAVAAVSLVGLAPGAPTRADENSAPARRATGFITERASAAQAVVVSAFLADGYAPDDPDEAVQIWNVGGSDASLAGWSLSDGESSAGFPPDAVLRAGERWWLARRWDAFEESFGHAPDWGWDEMAGRRMLSVGGGPALANAGDEVVLLDSAGSRIDVAVFGNRPATAGWTGEPIVPFHTSSISAANQVLYRKLDPATGLPVPDTDRHSDWASDPADERLGRRVRYPGWDVEDNLRRQEWFGGARFEVALAPDAMFGFLNRHLEEATTSVDFVAYTFDNPALAEVLAALAAEGVRVRVLLDGSPAGGLDGNARWCAALVWRAGGEVLWMGSAGSLKPRYASAHAKLIVIDDRVVIVSTENPGLGAAPYDDRTDGTLGRRGALLATDLGPAVAWGRSLVERDLDPRHADVRPYQERDPDRGAPAPDFEPARVGGGAGYIPRAPVPLSVSEGLRVQAISAPEQAVDPTQGTTAFAELAGAGDRLDVVQLREPLWWGRGGDTPPEVSPRLRSYRAAARRGAHVRVLLDGYFEEDGDPNGNRSAANWLNQTGAQEGIALEARLGNPAGLGIHAKLLVIRRTGQRGWTHLGSLNGSEISSKANREVAFQVESSSIADYLGRVIDADWGSSRVARLALPLLGGRR
jgi:hypothetical protein